MTSDTRPYQYGGIKPLPKPVRLTPINQEAIESTRRLGYTNTNENDFEQPKPVHVKIEPNVTLLQDRVRTPQYVPLQKKPQQISTKRKPQGSPYYQSRSYGHSMPSFLEAFLFMCRRLIDNIKFKLMEKTGSLSRVAGVAAIGLVVLLMVILGIWALVNKNAYAIYVDDALIGHIARAQEIDEDLIFARAVDYLGATLQATVQVNETLAIKAASASRKDLLQINDAIADISRAFTYKIEASAIMVDGLEISTLKNENEVQDVMDYLFRPFKYDGVDYVYVGFVEEWVVIKKLVDEDALNTVEETIRVLDRSITDIIEYTVVSDDTLAQIARRYNIPLDSIPEENQDQGITLSSILYPDMVLRLKVNRPYLSVETIEQASRLEVIPAPIRNEDNHLQPSTYSRILAEGEDGEQEVITRITRINGVKIREEDIETRIVKQPIDRVLEIGKSYAAPERRDN